MVTQSELEKLGKELEKLITKFKRNSNQGDKQRLLDTQQAYNAVRKVILNCAIKGDLIDMVPFKSADGFGWEVIDNNQKLVRFSGLK